MARSFSATLDQVELGVTTANFIQAARQRVCRTPAKIARSSDARFVLLQLRHGHMQLAQGAATVQVSEGQSVLIDAARPYELVCPVPTRALPRGAVAEQLAALLRSLRERLPEPRLDPQAIATQHRVSRRRLDRARELLSEPRQATLPVADVALRRGFVDASHFARRFRRAYGVSPLAYRAKVLGRRH